MKKFGLNKRDKLCSSIAIDNLFGHSAKTEDDRYSTIAYPLRAVWAVNKIRTDGSNIQFLISVPKKRLHHAVDRVKMRRRIREAYRLNHHNISISDDTNIDLALVFIADTLKDYKSIEKSLIRILSKIETSVDSQ